MAASHRSALEIEIKLRVAHIASLVRSLRRIGVTHRGRVLERNTLYDTPESTCLVISASSTGRRNTI